MYIIKLDLQDMGTLFFTGKRKVVQGEEQPGLTAEVEEAMVFDSEEEASDMCKKMIELFEMDFYYSAVA